MYIKVLLKIIQGLINQRGDEKLKQVCPIKHAYRAALLVSVSV